MRGRILVVDDQLFNRTLLSDLLGLDQHDVMAVESGDAALTALETQPFDLVLLDAY